MGCGAYAVTTGPRRARPIGRWFELDAAGHIVNPASWENVPAPVHPVVEAVRETYRERYGGALHSAYVRGSIVLGDAVRGIADLDTFAVVRPENPGGFVWWETPRWAGEEAQRAGDAGGWLTGVDFGCVTYHDDLDARNPTIAAVIATQALCLAGEDLRPRLRPRRPGPDMFVDHLRIGEEVGWLEDAAAGREPYDAERARAVLKRMLRVGFELVMEEEGRFATSVYLACESFTRHRPRHAASMRTVLELYLDRDAQPRPPLGALTGEVLPLGRWLVDEAARELEPRSPLAGTRR
jgi:hypothetical protein